MVQTTDTSTSKHCFITVSNLMSAFASVSFTKNLLVFVGQRGVS